MSVCIALCTAPDAPGTQDLVRTLVEEGLVACGNIVPGIESIYRWQGVIDTSREVLIIFKTTTETWPYLQTRVQELHPYEVPELLLLDVQDGLPGYLEWVAENARPVSAR